MRYKLSSKTVPALVVLALTIAAASGQTALVSYELSYKGVPRPGSTIVLVHSFTALGNVSVRIFDIGFQTEWYYYNRTETADPLPLDIDPGQTRSIETALYIPPTILPGNHSIWAQVQWGYSYAPQTWQYGEPIFLNSTIPVYSSSTGPFDWSGIMRPVVSSLLVWGLVGYLGASTIITAGFFYKEHRRRKSSTI